MGFGISIISSSFIIAIEKDITTVNAIFITVVKISLVRSCFVCDFRKSGKRYKDDTLGRDVEARCTRLHNKNTNTK